MGCVYLIINSRVLPFQRSIEFEIYTGKLANPNTLWKIIQYKFPKGFTDKVLTGYKGIAFIVDNSGPSSDQGLAKTLCDEKQTEFCGKHGWIIAIGDNMEKDIGCCYEVHTLLNDPKFTIKIPEISNLLTTPTSSIFHFKGSSSPKRDEKNVVNYEILSFVREIQLAEKKRHKTKILLEDEETPITEAWPELPKKQEEDDSMDSDVFEFPDNLEEYLGR